MWQNIIEKITRQSASEAVTEDNPPTTPNKLYFRSERFFYQAAVDNKKSGCGKDGWYFTLRGGETRGPYVDREKAQSTLNELIESFRNDGFTARN